MVPVLAARMLGCADPSLEAQLCAAAPSHPNVVRFRSSWSTGRPGSDEEALVLEFELCGGDLEAWMRRQQQLS